MWKLLEAIVVWIVVALGLWLLGELLLAVNADVTQSLGSFLVRVDVVVGFLTGLWYFFFGTSWRRV